MCEMCRSNPCNSRCPNADEPKIRGFCDNCGERLREDYTYFEDSDCNIFCDEDCAKAFHGIEETEWDNG